MGKDTEFEYGWNVPEPDYGTNDPPTYESYNQGEPIEEKPDECMGQVTCTRCKRFHGYCSEIRNFSTYRTGEENVINREGKSQGQMGRNGNRRNGLPFLTPKDATRTPQPAKIIAARVQPDGFKPGSQVVALRLEFKGQHWLFNLRENNPNLDSLCDAWGDDETRWGQRMLTVCTHEDMFDGKVYLEFEPATAEPEKVEPGKQGRK